MTSGYYRSLSAMLAQNAGVPQGQSGNLTGPKRLINDQVVNLYNALQLWNECFLKMAVIGQQLHMQIDCAEDQETDIEFNYMRLGVYRDKMKLQLGTLKNASTKLEFLAKLNTEKRPVFYTWTYADFATRALRIFKEYEKETNVKIKELRFIQERRDSDSEEWNAVFASLCQLAIPDAEIDLDVKAMVLEANISRTQLAHGPIGNPK